MSTRKRRLPPGWYPEDPDEIQAFLGCAQPGRAVAAGGIAADAVAAVAPHAGWAFSGALAAKAVACLRACDTVAVIGGHLPSRAAPLAAPEDGFETPLGRLEADGELRDALAALIDLRPDTASDNTVEVQLPLLAAAKPGVRVLWLRAPNGPASIALGEALARAAATIKRSVACLGSTDLTHYGPSYGFLPAGGGKAAETWVRGVNDARFIEALLARDPDEVLRRGETEGSACSSGAAAAAIAFSRAQGSTIARLLGYATSLDVRRDDSFVGYAAVAYA